MPGSSTQAADQRHDRDERFGQHAAEADEARMCDSFSIIFGVVPDEISEWKPETAPQAMVMNRNGNSVPENTGPVPSMKRVVAGIAQRRRDDVDADRQRDDVPILRKVLQVVARREHQPHRQAGGDGAVDDQRPRELRAV